MNEPIAVIVDTDIIDLAEGFLRHRRDDIQRGRNAVAASDLQELRRMGHELKGTAGSYGFLALSAIGARIEHAAIGGDLQGAADAMGEMSDFLDRVSIVPR